MKEKMRFGNLILIMSVFAFAAVLFSSCNIEKEYTIEYKVTGTAPSVDISLNNAGGDIEQHNNEILPYSKSFKITLEKDYDYFFAYLSAMNNGSYGTVRSAIYKNGALVKETLSSGAYAIATVSATIEY